MLHGRFHDYQVLRSGRPSTAVLVPAIVMAICVAASPFAGALPEDRRAALAVDPEELPGRAPAHGEGAALPIPVFGEDTRGSRARPDPSVIDRILTAGGAMLGAVPATAVANIGLRLCASAPLRLCDPSPTGVAASLGVSPRAGGRPSHPAKGS
ncbi:hypothetical protein [Aurantimonas sp. 22II-16-19i]|uniref:hypothetical protein n=1 Tax=Aurantimonas sp. 22II-16-19i TaxID=1317114 RepID=UPI0009F7E993|nr:hypothetical protein [Aurantimonas sp. 22II-16-19i]ORE94015.1 hypothetical protein ATO4_14714 [Aurantimonas sp. 22II-16-19i]